jgi:hypothetical protein
MSTLQSELRSVLLTARNADGGWPYYRGKASRLEPTSAALLAFDALGEPMGNDVLERWPRRDGLFVDGQTEAVNYGFNGFAGLALARTGSPQGAGLCAALLRVRGVTFSIPDAPTSIRQDSSLEGWSWIESTFGWIEPTAWCLLAVKRLTRTGRARDAAHRIDQAERLIFDRVCAGGGWNYGNSNVNGQNLAAFVAPTGAALLALQDQTGRAEVQRSLAFLDHNQTVEMGGLSLAMAGIALGVCGRPAVRAVSALAGEWERSRFIGNLHVTALALYARAAAGAGFEAFRV